MIDISSFIDYFAVEGYIARCGDWPNGNFALWRSRNVSEKPYEDGKWRWMLFNSFCANESFRRAFSTRLIELSDTVFETNHVSQKIQEYVELMENPIQKHYQRFFGISNEKFYEGIEIITTFFNQRRVYVMNSIKNNFGEEYLGDIS